MREPQQRHSELIVARVIGNVKGLQDYYRNHLERLRKEMATELTMVTSVADGTKISCDQAIVANATGFTYGYIARTRISRRCHAGWPDL